MRIAEAAEVVLKGAAEPMHVRDIATAIETQGLFSFRTVDRASVVSKALRKNERFVSVAPGRFTLRVDRV